MKIQCLSRSHRLQHGMVLEIVLVVLVALLLASVSLFRSVDTSSTVSGNIAFKSDANNRAQLAFDQVVAWAANKNNSDVYIVGGQEKKDGSKVDNNYSPRMLEVDAQGIPLIIKDTAAFDAVYTHAPPPSALMDNDGMKVRYLIERMCTTMGELDKNRCVYSYEGNPDTTSRGSLKDPDKPALRVTVRVDGPRNTVSYIQATVSP